MLVVVVLGNTEVSKVQKEFSNEETDKAVLLDKGVFPSPFPKHSLQVKRSRRGPDVINDFFCNNASDTDFVKIYRNCYEKDFKESSFYKRQKRAFSLQKSDEFSMCLFHKCREYRAGSHGAKVVINVAFLILTFLIRWDFGSSMFILNLFLKKKHWEEYQ